MRSHVDGTLETIKFSNRRAEYHRNLDLILGMGYENEDFIHYFPAFAGNLTLNRYFTLYEIYKKVLGISGHICEVGVYKGGSTLLFGKLVEMFEPDSLVMVHGMDWFRGTAGDPENPLQVHGENREDEERLRRLITLQGLDDTIRIHNINVEIDLPDFFDKHPHLQFKLVFLDSGTYECVSESIKHFWPRLSVGGVMIFDQFNNEVAPGETRAVKELLPKEKIQTIPNSWMPSSYILKGGS